MTTVNLVDTMPFEYQILEEAAGSHAPRPLTVAGVFQRGGVKNANGRVYPTSLWEKLLTDADIKDRISKRMMLGELDHPSDGQTRLERVSHLVTHLINEKDGVVNGKAEVFDTPKGLIVQELFKKRATVGISSRGTGTVDKEGQVNPDYKLVTFDFVSTASTPGAYPTPVSESLLESIKEALMEKLSVEDTVRRLKDYMGELPILRATVPLILEDEQKRVDLLRRLTEVRAWAYHLKEKEPSLSALADELLSEADGVRTELDNVFHRGPKSYVYAPRGGTGMTENTEMVRLQEENAQLRARVSELETEVEGLVEDQARFEASVQIIEELLKRYQGLREEYTALKALSEDRLATSEQIINTLASDEDEADLDEEDGDVDDVEFTETVERLDAAMQLIDEMVDRMQSLVREEAAAEELLEAAINFCREGVLEAYADDLTQNLANGGEIKSMLLEHCPDVASMDAMFGKLRVITEAVVPAGLPLNEEQDMLLQEDTFDDHRAIEERPMSEGAKLALHLVQKLGLS